MHTLDLRADLPEVINGATQKIVVIMILIIMIFINLIMIIITRIIIMITKSAFILQKQEIQLHGARQPKRCKLRGRIATCRSAKLP